MSPDFIIDKRNIILRRSIFCLVVFLLPVHLYATQGFAQRVAILTPDNDPRSTAFASDLATSFGNTFKLIDMALAEAAFKSVTVANPYNITIGEARNIAAVIGCDYFIVLRAGGHRRTSLVQGDYYETFAFFYIIDGRTGTLLEWTRESFEKDTQAKADDAFGKSVHAVAAKVTATLKSFIDRRTSFEKRQLIEEVPPEGSPAAVGLKPPVPYKRIKPQYPSIAFLYDVKATIDIEADIGADGAVLAVRVVRWAGFNLEAAVEKAVREMNWRPAMRNGKALPMRILLRYNFTKVDKDV